MTTVFLSGSRHLSRINDKIRGRIRSMAAGRLHIIVGDANGADKAMAKRADIGFVLWDGKSTGSVANALELLKADKKVVVYYAPEKQFYNLSSMDDIERLLRKCRPDVLSTISRKVELAGFPGVTEPDGQTASALSG